MFYCVSFIFFIFIFCYMADVSLTRFNRKLRRKYGVGTLTVCGKQDLARMVRDQWEKGDKRKWGDNYIKGCEKANWDIGEKLLAEWYGILEKYSDELSREVSKIYAKMKADFHSIKKRVLREHKEEVKAKVLGKVAEALAMYA